MQTQETARQAKWREAAEQERRAGNDFGAALFTLIGQSSPREAEAEKAVAERSSEPV